MDRSIEDALFLKVAWRLLPILFVSYVVAYIDRVNIGFAKLQMLDDLHFSAAVYGLGSGIFFVGFLLFEIPSNLILHKVGARAWLTRIMVTWGIISVATLWVQTPMQFYVARFLLGVAEAGFLPGVVYYLSQWFPARRQGRVLSILITAAAVGGILVGPLSGWIMEHFADSTVLRNWQWLLLLQGAPAVLVAALLWFNLPDSAEGVKWLNDEEKRMLKALNSDTSVHVPRPETIRAVMGSAPVWLLAVTLMAVNLGIYATIFWMPTIIQESGVSSFSNIGYISALPYFGAAIAMLVLGRSSDYFGERRWHIAGTCVLAAGGLLLSTMGSDPVLRIIGVIIATAGFIGTTPLIWALSGNYMSGRAAATGFALMNAIAALGGLFGPYLMGLAKDMTGSTSTAVVGIAMIAVLGGVSVLMLSRAAGEEPPRS